MPDARDWTITTRGECPDCGYDASSIETSGFDEALEFEAGAWCHWLGSADAFALRSHTIEGVWSGIEYACHVRDLLAVLRLVSTNFVKVRRIPLIGGITRPL